MREDPHPFVGGELLGALRQYSALAPALKSLLQDFPQLHLVLDTNIIVEDLVFLTRRRRNPKATTALLEVLSAQTIIAYFPLEKREEVHAKCREISQRYKIPLSVLLEHWSIYAQHLRFVPVSDLGTDWADCRILRDRTDLEFFQVRHAVGAQAFLTHDKDFTAAGARVLKRTDILIDLRDYTRQKAMQAGIVLAGSAVALVPVAGIVLLIKGLYAAWRRVPREWLAAGGIAFLVAMLIPKSREKILGVLQGGVKAVKGRWVAIEPMLIHMAEEHQKAEREALRIKEVIEPRISSTHRQRVTLRQAIYRACLAKRQPMTEAEIWESVQQSGFQSRAADPQRALSVALRRHPRLLLQQDDRWVIATEVGGQEDKTPSS